MYGEIGRWDEGGADGFVRQNSLFNSALKQTASVKKDLASFAESPVSSSPALQGMLFCPSPSFRFSLARSLSAETEKNQPTIQARYPRP